MQVFAAVRIVQDQVGDFGDSVGTWLQLITIRVTRGRDWRSGQRRGRRMYLGTGLGGRWRAGKPDPPVGRVMKYAEIKLRVTIRKTFVIRRTARRRRCSRAGEEARAFEREPKGTL